MNTPFDDLLEDDKVYENVVFSSIAKQTEVMKDIFNEIFRMHDKALVENDPEASEAWDGHVEEKRCRGAAGVCSEGERDQAWYQFSHWFHSIRDILSTEIVEQVNAQAPSSRLTITNISFPDDSSNLSVIFNRSAENGQILPGSNRYPNCLTVKAHYHPSIDYTLHLSNGESTACSTQVGVDISGSSRLTKQADGSFKWQGAETRAEAPAAPLST